MTARRRRVNPRSRTSEARKQVLNVLELEHSVRWLRVLGVLDARGQFEGEDGGL